MKRNIARKILSVVLVVMIALAPSSCSLLGSCSLFSSIEFSADELSGEVGQTLHLVDLISGADYYTLTSSNEGVALVTGSSFVKLVGRGSAQITAEASNGTTDTITLRADYAPLRTIELNVAGNLIQRLGSTEPITFSAIYNEGVNHFGACWDIDGVFTNTLADFYTVAPFEAVGEYVIKAYSGDISATKTVVIYDENPPIAEETNQPAFGEDFSFDYYKSYPRLNLLWGNRKQETAQITLEKNGQPQQITVNIADGFKDLSPYISVTDSFKILVGGVEKFVFTGLNSAAKTHLAKKYVGGNHYLRSLEELGDFFEYLVAFRPDGTTKNGKTTVKANFFVAFSPPPAARLENSLVDRLNTTGSYDWRITGLRANATAQITINFHTENAPSDYSTLDEKLPTMLTPKFSATGDDAAIKSEKFPLSPIKVATSDQLYFTLERGYNPDLKQGSAAQRLYNKAATALKQITDSTMSEVEKAAAIYDYVMIKTTYDETTSDTKVPIETSVKKGAYYIEGVFDSGFAVCDGIAKAYSLMCNMAGIENRRVTGLVRQSEWGAHAWNKVKIEGNWYICDPTWDIVEYDDHNYNTYKLGSKSKFLLGESDFYLTRCETGSIYPVAATSGYNYYQKNGFYVHNYNINATLNEISEQFLQMGKDYILDGESCRADYLAAEIYINKSGIDMMLMDILGENVKFIRPAGNVLLMYR